MYHHISAPVLEMVPVLGLVLVLAPEMVPALVSVLVMGLARHNRSLRRRTPKGQSETNITFSCYLLKKQIF
jgi:hypothetical protein